MSGPLRIVLVAARSLIFQALYETCAKAGHDPVAYVYGRSAKPRAPAAANAGARVTEILAKIPRGMDLLLPGSAEGLAAALPGYRPDLVVVYGLAWRVPRSVLDVPRLGVLNVHASALPRYRGPIPVHWAIRNGDPDFGVTVHWMDETFDTGNIVAQRRGIPLDEDQTFAGATAKIAPVVQELLEDSLPRIADGFRGEPQDDREASYAGWMEPEFDVVDWSHPVRDIHNQVRTFRYGMASGPGPVAEVAGEWLTVLRTSVTAADGIRVECADGPIWIVESAPGTSPAR